jgi:hypothetical protein
VSSIDLGAPIWLVAIIAVLSVAGGIFGINIVKNRERRNLKLHDGQLID